MFCNSLLYGLLFGFLCGLLFGGFLDKVAYPDLDMDYVVKPHELGRASCLKPFKGIVFYYGRG